MERVCVMTSKSRAYYTLVSRLRKAGIAFQSLVPGSDDPKCLVVLTTREEQDECGPRAMPIEELDENPFVMKGQILSRIDGGIETVYIGVDPGTRIGMAVFYGEAPLEFSTFDSVRSLSSRVTSFVRRVPARRSVVRIGNGNPSLAAELAETISDEVPAASLEFVNEEGTSARIADMKGLQGDQRAAARIAFRKGFAFPGPGSRIPG